MKEILQKLKETKTVAETEVVGDYRTIPGRQMVRRQAQEDIKKLFEQVGEEFKKVGFTVFINGPGANDFIKEAKNITEVVEVDFHEATQNLRTNIEMALAGRNKEFSPSAFAIMVRELKQIGADLGLTSIPDIEYDGPEQANSTEAINGVLDAYMAKYMGADFIAKIVEHAAIDKVVSMDGSNPVVPVLVTNINPKEHLNVSKYLFGGNFVSATASDNVTSEDVVEVFNKIKEVKNPTVVNSTTNSKKNNKNDTSNRKA